MNIHPVMPDLFRHPPIRPRYRCQSGAALAVRWTPEQVRGDDRGVGGC